MSFRNLSPQRMFFDLALEHEPKYGFSATNKEEFLKWKSQALPEVISTLGDFPEEVPLNPELMAEWKDGLLLKQRWLIDVQKHLSATFLVNIPLTASGDLPSSPLPGILCCHGHGPYGKEPVMGNASSPELKSSIEKHNYDYGKQMAESGYVTFAIDWIGFGERNDGNKPNFLGVAKDRDWCNLYYLHATMLGMTSLSINLAHGKAATTFAGSLPFVDEARLGVMGLSGGGTMTLWMTLCDDRFIAAEIICYSDLWPYFGFRDINYCGMQVTPGLFRLVDLPDLQGLIAPRPLLIDIGANDTCFRVDTSMACFKRLEKIYEAAGSRDMLELDLHPGEHGWGGNFSKDFFYKHLVGGEQ